jgi:RNA polymerase sigma-70 factor (ECF subfamily)
MSKSSSIEQQFKEIYERDSDMIFRFCATRISDREQALDVVQDTFMRLWKTFQQGEKVDNTKAFLFTVAHRLIIDWYRKKKSLSLDEMDNEDGEAYEPVEDGIKIDIENNSEARFVLDKINELNSGNRTVLHLRYIEGLSPPEIASILGISTNATSVRINRALAELKKITGYNE